MSTGNKIIEGLKAAVIGNFDRVTIEGQMWVRRGIPADRCDHCDNGLEVGWIACPWCGLRVGSEDGQSAK